MFWYLVTKLSSPLFPSSKQVALNLQKIHFKSPNVKCEQVYQTKYINSIAYMLFISKEENIIT